MPTEKKRMLEVKKHSGKLNIYINNSSMEVINACMRKAHYLLDLGYVKNEPSEALVFGTAIHKALETYYLTGQSQGSIQKAIEAFEKANESLHFLDKHDPHSTDNGKLLLGHYFDNFHEDQYWEVVTDEKGPLIEREFEIKIAGSELVDIYFFGTIDMIMRNRETDEVFVWDTKTTSQLGDMFYKRVKPNHQFTGYIYAAREHFKLPVKSLIMNGLHKKNLIAKTSRGIQPPQFARVETTRDEDDFKEWMASIVHAARMFYQAQEKGHWPLNAGSSCSAFGGCQYYEACIESASQRKNVLASLYNRI